MLLIQMTGLSGAGKTTLAFETQRHLTAIGYAAAVIDGDEYRRHLCSDLGFSKADRLENIRRLGAVGLSLAARGVIVLIAAINPYEEGRQRLNEQSDKVYTVYISCPLVVLVERDVKGLYRRAHLPTAQTDHIPHFTGISDVYEPPLLPDLLICSDVETIAESAGKIVDFILCRLPK